MNPDPEAVVEEVAELAVLPPCLMVGEEPLVQVGFGCKEGEEDLDPGFMYQDMPQGIPLGPCAWFHPMS
jgi:hypothetical protein